MSIMHLARIAALAAIFLLIPTCLYAEQHYSVQAGSLSDKARAQKVLSRLFSSGYDCRSEKQGEQFKVICGKFKNLKEVKSFKQKLRSKGYADAFAVRVTTDANTNRVTEKVDPDSGEPISQNLTENANSGKEIPVEYYSVQVGSLSDKARAQKIVSRLFGSSVECSPVPVGFKFSVLCGQVRTVPEARALRQKLKALGYSDAFAVHVLNGGIIKDISIGVDPEDKLTGALADVEAVEQGALEYYSVQIGSLGDRARAEKLVIRISSSDIECVPIGIGGKFKVLCGSYDSIVKARKMKQKLISMGFADSFTVLVKGVGGPRDDILNINKNLNLLQKRLPPVSTPVEQASIGSSIWGREGGHFHPFLAVSTVFTDNLYSSNSKKRAPEEDSVTVSSLGFWLSSPAVKKPIREISTIGHIPGGFRGVDILPYHDSGRLAFLSYKAENRRFAEHGYEDGTSHYARGYAGYETPGGHRIVLDERYESSRSFVGNAISGTGFVNSPGEYKTNRFLINCRLSTSDKTSLELYHVSFGLSYDDSSKSIWNRDDTVNALKFNVGAFSKTHIFLKYSLKEVDYVEVSGKDRKEGEYSLGLRWNMTGKTSGLLEFGKSSTEFDGSVMDSDDELMVYSGRLDYKASSKAELSFTFSKSRSESDNIGSHYFIHNSLGLSARLYPSSKLRADVGVNRAENNYYSIISNGDDNLDREDVRTFGYVMFSYILNRNVAIELGATYAGRSSSLDIYDFDANGLYTGIAASF